jgi:small GTP-binding protein
MSRDSRKIIIVGDSMVGKTSLARRHAFDSFDDKMLSTVGMDRLMTNVRVGNTIIELSLWDTAGQEQFASLTPMYSRDAAVCLLVAAINDSTTCCHLLRWKEILIEGGVQGPFIVAFNKCDSIASDSDIRLTAQMTYRQHFKEIYFVSAKTGEGIDNLFQGIGLATMAQARVETPAEQQLNLAGGEVKSGCKC